MISLIKIFSALSCLLISVSYGFEKGTPHGTAIDLTDDTFDDYVTTDPANGLWLLKFYAPWCGHCKKLAPTLEQVAAYMQGKMAIGKIDCTKQTKICKRFEIKGYPTLKVYRDGVFMDYPGERHADAFIIFGERMSSNAVALIQTYQDSLDKLFLNKGAVAFVAYDPKLSISDKGSTSLEDMLQSTSILQVFNQIARKQQITSLFGLLSPTMTEDQFLEFGFGKPYKEEPFFAKIEKDVAPIIYIGEWSSPEFLDFVKLNNHPLVAELSGHNFRALGSIGPILAIGVVDPADIEKTSAFQKEMKDFAASSEKLRGKYIFAWMDGIKFEKFLKQFGIEKSNLPQVFALDFLSRHFWQDASVLSIKKLIEAIENGDLEMQKQADPPTLNAFQQVKMVFMEFMPWSALMVALMFILTFLAFMPEKEEVGSSSVPTDSLKVEEEKEPKKER